MDKKRVVILGGGAVGSSFAAAISKVRHSDVTLIGRKAHVDQINSSGLELTGKFQETFQLNAQEKIDSNLENTLLMVTVKSVDLETSLKQISGFIKPTTTVLLTQNGWGIKDIATDSLKAGTDKIFCGIIGMGATFTTPGSVQCWGGNILVEKAFTETEWSSVFEELFLDYANTDNIEKAIWRKLIINSIVNPLSVLLNARNREVANASSNDIKSDLMKEALAVASSRGIEINLNLEKFNTFIKSPNYTSMYQDIQKGRRTEIDFINGAIVKLGEEKGIDTPTHELILKLIKARETLNLQR